MVLVFTVPVHAQALHIAWPSKHCAGATVPNATVSLIEDLLIQSLTELYGQYSVLVVYIQWYNAGILLHASKDMFKELKKELYILQYITQCIDALYVVRRILLC